MLKANFREGINTPKILGVLDNRINNGRDALLGIIEGNLNYSKMLFKIFPKFTVSLKDKWFDYTLS